VLGSEEPVTPSLREIASVFTRYANLTWGGGSATIATLREQILAKRHWLRESEFELSYALSRLTPGTNLLAFCTAAGWTRRGWRGALVALLASSLPCSLLVLLVTVFYEQLRGSSWFQAALHGALAAAVAIMAATAWVFAEPHVKAAPRKAIAIVPLTIGLAVGLRLSPVVILLVSAVIGAAWPVPKKQDAG